MKIKNLFIVSALLLLTAMGGRAQNTATYEYEEVDGWLKVTSSGSLDLSALAKTVNVIEIKHEGVTIQNLEGKYVGVGQGTLLYPSGSQLSENKSIDTPDTYVLMADVDAGKYTIGNSGLGTLCFPNTVSLEDYEGLQAFKATEVKDDILVLEDAVDEYGRIPAGTPVILFMPGGVELVLGNTGEISQAPTTIAQDYNLLVGINNTMTVQPVDGHSHFLMQSHDGKVGFYAACEENGTPRSFKATRFRCFLDLPAASHAKALNLTIPTTVQPSAIDGVGNAAPVKEGLYTLGGQPVSQPLHGNVYIMSIGGRMSKVLIK